MRVHTAGSVGGSTAVVATHLIESQVHERVLTLAFEKQSEGDTNFAFSSGRSGGVGAGGYFAPHIRAYIERSGAPDVRRPDGRGQGSQERAEEPVRALADPATSASRWCWSRRWCGIRSTGSSRAPPPTARARWCSPTRRAGRRRPRPPAWVHGTAVRTELGWFPGRDPVNPRAARTARPTCTARPASPTRARTSTSSSATCRSAGTSRCGWRTSGSPRSATAGR